MANLKRTKELFKDVRKLSNRNFEYGLRRYGITDPGIDAPEMAMYIDEEGYMNFGDKERLYLFQAQDPIDAPIVAEYSKENLFIEGLRKAIGGDLPVKAIILWPNENPPDGFGLCNSSVYRVGPRKGDTFTTPNILPVELVNSTQSIHYIQKLPDGATLEREGRYVQANILN